MEFQDLIKKRYSCRKFSDAPVSADLIEKVIEAASLAPTAMNTQPFKIWLISSQGAKENINSVTSYSFGANNFMVLGSKSGNSWVRPYDNMDCTDIDAAIAGTHIMLAMYEYGLATTWVASFNAPELKKLYPQMSEYKLLGLFPFGYPAADSMPSSSHEKRKSFGELTEVL